MVDARDPRAVLKDLLRLQAEIAQNSPKKLGSLSLGDLPEPVAEQAAISKTEHAFAQAAADLFGQALFAPRIGPERGRHDGVGPALREAGHPQLRERRLT